MLLLRRVSGQSMEPQLPHGRLVVVHRKNGVAQVGQVVMFRHAGLEKVKRVTDIAADGIFVRGDNPAASTDSRHFGWIARESIIGSVLWPRI